MTTCMSSVNFFHLPGNTKRIESPIDSCFGEPKLWNSPNCFESSIQVSLSLSASMAERMRLLNGATAASKRSWERSSANAAATLVATAASIAGFDAGWVTGASARATAAAAMHRHRLALMECASRGTGLAPLLDAFDTYL